MKTVEENIFVVGPEASGDSFFGRSKEIIDIESIFSSVSAIHLVGPTRIGKSSLISKVFEKNRDYPMRICVQMNMGECQDAFDFWSTLSFEIKEQLLEKGLWNNSFERHYKNIERINQLNSDWFQQIKLSLQSILKQLKKINYRLVLSIDEFDSVIRVLGNNSACFMVLRSIFEKPDYSTSGVIISRRRLHLLEAQCKDLSTFHGVFREMPLHSFNEKDMEDFYNSLQLYDIKLSSGGKKKLEKFTGKMPYLCCMFAERLVKSVFSQGLDCYSVGDKEINVIFKECRPQIDVFYDDLVALLEYDNRLEMVFYLSLTSKFPSYITKRDIENLTMMGVLIPDESNNTINYFAYSKDFMTFIRLRPLKLSSWDTITQSEKRVKAIIRKEFPRLDEVTYNDLIANNISIIQDLNSEYPGINLNSGKIMHYCEDLSAFKEHPTILDVLTLSDAVNIILGNWSTRFHKYFSGDDSWKTKLEFIKDLRNPIAHAAIEYISQEELSTCMQYCDEIIHLKY